MIVSTIDRSVLLDDIEIATFPDNRTAENVASRLAVMSEIYSEIPDGDIKAVRIGNLRDLIMPGLVRIQSDYSVIAGQWGSVFGSYSS